MATQEKMKRRIARTEDLDSVVGTMKAMAAVSIRQYEQAVASLDEFNRTVELGLRAVLRTSTYRPPGNLPHQQGRRLAVILGSDQGMCGKFNEDLIGFATNELDADAQGRDWELLAMGDRIASPLSDGARTVLKTLRVPGSVKGITAVIHELIFALGQIEALGEVRVYFNQHRSGTSYEPQRLRLLPVDLQWYASLRRQDWPTRQLPFHRLPAEQIFAFLIRQYLFVSLYRAVAHSLAGENASRLASMQAAENNIDEKLGQLRAVYHRTRQSAITEELLDIVSGFEALSGA